MQVTDVRGVDLLPVLAGLVRVLRQSAAADGLSSVAGAVLHRLALDGPHRVTDLARREATSQPGMTQLVARLHKEGLVRRAADPSDRRASQVEVTDAGRAVLERARARHATTLQALLDRLDPLDRQAVGAALPALARLLE